MVNLKTLKKDVYQREKKKLLRKFIFVNILSVLFFSLTISGTKITEREKELLQINKEITFKYDSLMTLTTNQLLLLKENENKIIRKSLSMDMDTSYVDMNLSVGHIYEYVENQLVLYTNIEKVVESKWDSINSIPTGMPISLADLCDYTDSFGYRKHPIVNKLIFHEGIDMSASIGSDVFVTGNGIVEKVIKNSKGYGNRIVINHGNGYKTVYAHLDEFKVSVGQKVKKNDLIATVGNTGSTTGPHLHYEILIRNRPIDPYNFFNIDNKIPLASR
jgi:hypothetical protein